MTMAKNKIVLDNEELELLEEIERREWIDAPLSEEERENYAQNAAYTKALQEKRQTTIRFSVSDLAIIKAKAKEMGIGYQNLIQTLVHNYAHDKIKLGL
jgi:predicted DNA binding CopG/RHH family protein